MSSKKPDEFLLDFPRLRAYLRSMTFTMEERPALVTTCSQCGEKCQNVDSYSDCCDEYVTTQMGTELVKVYR